MGFGSRRGYALGAPPGSFKASSMTCLSTPGTTLAIGDPPGKGVKAEVEPRAGASPPAALEGRAGSALSVGLDSLQEGIGLALEALFVLDRPSVLGRVGESLEHLRRHSALCRDRSEGLVMRR
jgi:hypothetical protein